MIIMKKSTLLIIAVILAVTCAAVILAMGRSYTVKVMAVPDAETVDDISVEIEEGAECAEITGVRLENGMLRIDLRSKNPGKVWINAYCRGEAFWMGRIIVHRSGIITYQTFFGDCRGSRVISIAVAIYIALLLYSFVKRYREGMAESLYQYRNVKYLSLIIYFGALLLGQLLYIYRGDGLDRIASNLLDASSLLSIFALPVAFVVSIAVTISNIRLMQREGRSVRNMLACILGILICLGTLFPTLLGAYLQRAEFVDVHNQNSPAPYIEMAVEDGITAVLTYLECVLLGTIILGIKAARAVPAFDKDYILILGCKVKSDGSLTNLLKGRADRALEFARRQKEKTGKGICFVPSGGKGDDEVISEAEAVKNYLLGEGISEDSILVEDLSTNTEENFRNSLALIKQRSKDAEAKIAFSTTNYHVFRSGILANSQGVRAEGIGSKTRSYFWINAFVREFIATLSYEWRTHIAVIAAMLAVMLGMVVIVYLSNIL